MDGERSFLEPVTLVNSKLGHLRSDNTTALTLFFADLTRLTPKPIPRAQLGGLWVHWRTDETLAHGSSLVLSKRVSHTYPMIFKIFLCSVALCAASMAGDSPAVNNDPHSVQRVAPKDDAVLFRISGVLQANDSQYVHDVICSDTGEKIGTVRMRWAHKYGHRYGGVGVATEGNVECVWQGDMGWVKIALRKACGNVAVVPRVAKITD
jgi:hypothetical protein